MTWYLEVPGSHSSAEGVVADEGEMEILDGEGAEPRRVAVSPSRALLNELRVNEGR